MALVTVVNARDDTESVAADVETIRSLLPGPDGSPLRTLRHRPGRLRGRPQRGGRGPRRHAAGDHRRARAGPDAAHLPLAADRGADARRGGDRVPDRDRRWSTGSCRPTLTTVSGQSTAILIVLMFGAGTDYCLLIVSRFRDELRRSDDVEAAMMRAAARTGPAIFASGGDRGRRDARAQPRRLQRDARDGPAARARHRRDDGLRRDAAAGAAGGLRAARVLARDPAREASRARRARAGRASARSSGAGRRCSSASRSACSCSGALGNLERPRLPRPLRAVPRPARVRARARR